MIPKNQLWYHQHLNFQDIFIVSNRLFRFSSYNSTPWSLPCQALIGSCAAGPAPPPGTPIPAAPFLDSATQTQQVSMPSNSKAIYLNIIFKIFIAGFTIVCHQVFSSFYTTSVWCLIYMFWAQRSTDLRADSTRCTETSAYSARSKYMFATEHVGRARYVTAVYNNQHINDKY